MRPLVSNSGDIAAAPARADGATAVPGLAPAAEAQAGAPFHETRYGWAVLGVVWAASAAYTAAYLRHGWVPVDAGTLGQMAERVLQGQVPFRDFGEIYTGGLTYLNALAFRLFGVNLLSLRIALFLFFLGWAPSVYFLARRFVGPLGAGAATLLSVAWSVPNYPEAMPSWYNLFFATWGTLALARYAETNRKKWLWVAGMCGGFSFLAKISGLFFVAAGLLFLVFREIVLSHSGNSPAALEVGESGNISPPLKPRQAGAPLGMAGKKNASRGGAFGYQAFASAGAIAFFATVGLLIAGRPTLTNFICFVLPVAALVGFLLWEIWRMDSDGSLARIRRLLEMILPFLGGVAAPIAAFLVWFASRGALRAWFDGAFLLAMRRMQWAVMSPNLTQLGTGLLPVALVLAAAYAPKRIRRVALGAAAVALAVIFVECGRSYRTFESVGKAPLLLVPLGAMAAAIWLALARNADARARQNAFLLTSVAAVTSLIEYPYTAPIYFCYVAPLVALALVALLAARNGPGRFSMGMLAAFYLAFAVWLHTPGYFATLRLPPPPEKPAAMRQLRLKRAGGIRVASAEASEYEALIAAVRAHAGGPYIYAGVDCPEVYFLSGERNPTGTIWDFLDPDFFSGSRTPRILETIADHDVKTVVLHNDPYFSGREPAELREALDARFPNSERVGDFEVRWK
jgi:hypothetical protein